MTPPSFPLHWHDIAGRLAAVREAIGEQHPAFVSALAAAGITAEVEGVEARLSPDGALEVVLRCQASGVLPDAVTTKAPKARTPRRRAAPADGPAPEPPFVGQVPMAARLGTRPTDITPAPSPQPLLPPLPAVTASGATAPPQAPSNGLTSVKVADLPAPVPPDPEPEGVDDLPELIDFSAPVAVELAPTAGDNRAWRSFAPTYANGRLVVPSALTPDADNRFSRDRHKHNERTAALATVMADDLKGMQHPAVLRAHTQQEEYIREDMREEFGLMTQVFRDRTGEQDISLLCAQVNKRVFGGRRIMQSD